MIRTDVIRPIRELLAGHAERMPGKVAFRDATRSLTYAQLAQRVARIGANLAALGLNPGDRCAIFMDNSVTTIECYLGIARAAAIGVCMNPLVADAELAYMLGDSGAKIAIVDAPRYARVKQIAAGLPALERVIVARGVSLNGDAPEATNGAIAFAELAELEPRTAGERELPLDAPAWMIYTSGTTGRPKGVLLTQRSNLWVVAACWMPICGLNERDDVLSPLPLFHSYALNLTVLGVLAAGASEYIMPRFSTQDVLRLLREEPFTVMPGVPTMFHYLLEAAKAQPWRPQHMRLFISAGAIMPKALNEQFEASFNVPLLDGYGITETSTMVTMNWPSGGRPMGSCGLPIPGSTVRIVDTEDRDVPPFTDGEILVAGPHVMLGYYNNPDATARALGDGFYRTGDLGRRDENGYLTITGRIKELIIRGGENIYPAEVEEALVQHESVLDCAVASKPDTALGEIVVAYVVPREGHRVDPEALREFCRARLTSFKVPSAFHHVDTIPRTGSGKIMRFKLQEAAAR